MIAGGRTGFDRLEVLAATWEPTTSALFDQLGLAPGMTCLDVGCGGGAVTRLLARRVGPAGTAVGIDMDEVKIALGRSAAAADGLANVDLRVSDVYDLDLAVAFDLVYARALLQHLTRPVDVLRAMWRAVRPGGLLVVEDADFEGMFSDPPDPGVDFQSRTYQEVLRRRGGDPVVGRRLLQLFRTAGITSPTLSVVQRADVSGPAKALRLLTLDTTAEAVVAEGVATAEEVRAAREQLAAFTERTDTVIGSPRMFQAWARRGAAVDG